MCPASDNPVSHSQTTPSGSEADPRLPKGAISTGSPESSTVGVPAEGVGGGLTSTSGGLTVSERPKGPADALPSTSETPTVEVPAEEGPGKGVISTSDSSTGVPEEGRGKD